MDIRLINGDRLRIYDINEAGHPNTWNIDAKFNPQIMEELIDEKRTLINS